jgi:hypothetical protein
MTDDEERAWNRAKVEVRNLDDLDLAAFAGALTSMAARSGIDSWGPAFAALRDAAFYAAASRMNRQAVAAANGEEPRDEVWIDPDDAPGL